MKNDFIEKLEKYFEETPREKIMKDWEKSKDFDNIGITVEDFLKNNTLMLDKNLINTLFFNSSDFFECEVLHNNKVRKFKCFDGFAINVMDDEISYIKYPLLKELTSEQIINYSIVRQGVLTISYKDVFLKILNK